MNTPLCPTCGQPLAAADGTPLCPICNTQYRERNLCPACGSDLEVLKACGAIDYFCPSCKALQSRGAVVRRLERD